MFNHIYKRFIVKYSCTSILADLEVFDFSKAPITRVDKLLSSMGYGSRSQISALAKAGGILLDGTPVRDAAKRIEVGMELPSRILIDGDMLDPLTSKS